MIPVYPNTPTPQMTPEQEQQRERAKRRTSMFAQLANDPLFQSEFVDGFVAEAESAALADLEVCEIADLARARDQWVNTKQLRQRIKDEMAAAPAHLKELSQFPS